MDQEKNFASPYWALRIALGTVPFLAGAAQNSFRADACRNAKKICRLNRRQVEMARELGMNPKKFFRLRPNPQQRSEAAGGRQKRFEQASDPATGCGAGERHYRSDVSGPGSGLLSRQSLRHLEAWLEERTPPKVLTQLIQEFREIADALETGSPILPFSEIPQLPGRFRHAEGSSTTVRTRVSEL